MVIFGSDCVVMAIGFNVLLWVVNMCVFKKDRNTIFCNSSVVVQLFAISMKYQNNLVYLV